MKFLEKNEPLILLIIILLIATFSIYNNVEPVKASTVTLTMDKLPQNDGWGYSNRTAGNGTAYVSNGILTIEQPPTASEFDYDAPASWANSVSNIKGWIVEFRLKIDPSTVDPLKKSYGAIVNILISDNLYWTIIAFSTDRIYLGVPTEIVPLEYFMNTTDDFHVYKIIGKEDTVKVFVDGKLALDYQLTRTGEYTSAYLTFRVSNYPPFSKYVKTYWDYFSYNTNPTEFGKLPTLTVINGTSSYYVSNLSGVTSDSIIKDGIYAGWCVDVSTIMVRNVAHDVELYSTLDSSSMPIPARSNNWSSVNYVLNHKQGSMQEVQDAIWYFFPVLWRDKLHYTIPPLNETDAWNMINAANANYNYVPSKGEIMGVLAYTGYSQGAQNTILEYKIP